MSTRVKLPTDREGEVTKVKLGIASLYITANKGSDGLLRELFGSGDDNTKPELDGLCGLVSIALQGGTYKEVLRRIIKFLRYRRYEPMGGIGQPCSVSDALAQVMEKYEEKE